MIRRVLAPLLLCVTAVIASPVCAQTFTTLYTFTCAPGDVSCLSRYGPTSALVQGADGNLYGATASDDPSASDGSVFRITPSGVLTMLSGFVCVVAFNCPDGEDPLDGGALVQGANGAFYGTTVYGGATYHGTVFKLTNHGTLSSVYSFCSQPGDSPDCAGGANPVGLAALGDDLYATTSYGGAPCAAAQGLGCGTIVKITKDGVPTTLHQFCAEDDSAHTCPNDGFQPLAPLTRAAGGNFYGTAESGGGQCSAGTVFRMTPTGVFTKLHSFCEDGSAHGVTPQGPLIQASDGNLYGVTVAGGANGGGTIFRITPKGKFTTIYNFCGTLTCAIGRQPAGGLMQATDGNLYGTTEYGGPQGNGTLFKITLSGDLTTLYTWNGSAGHPDVPLVQATNGIIYGSTRFSYSTGLGGSIFSLSLALGPFVKTRTSIGTVGASVDIFGNNLTGSTSVTFNGTPASFSVVSSTEIAATVPLGATSGLVTVYTPSGPLISNAVFTIRP